MKKLPILIGLNLLSFQLAAPVAFAHDVMKSNQDATTFNCGEDLPPDYRQYTRASLIITGSVESINQAVKIRVYGIVNKPQGFLLVPSDIVDVTPADKTSYKAGSNVLIFATLVDQAQATNIVEVEHQNISSDPETVTAQATRELTFLNRSVKDASFCKLLHHSDAVVFGKVTCVSDGGSMSYGRHLARWNKASFFVTESLKGVDAGKVIQVEFPVSLSPVWKEWPSFVAGEESALVLKKVNDQAGQKTNIYVAETLSSKIPLEVFDVVKATATVRGLKTSTENQTDVSEDQCHESSADLAKTSSPADDVGDLVKSAAVISHRPTATDPIVTRPHH